MALQTRGLHTCPLYSWGHGSDSVALQEGGGGPRQAGRPCSPTLPHLPACHQLPVNQVTVLPTLPRTPPPARPYLSLHLEGAVSELRFPWAEGEQADRPPVVRAQVPGPDALPILSPDPRPAGQQPQVSSREPCPQVGLRIQKGSLATPPTFSHGEAFGGQALHQGPPSLSTALGSCNSISESEVAQSCPTLCDPVDCSPPGPSVPGILRARTLEWGATSFSKGSYRPRDRTWVSHIAGRRFTF